MCEEGREGVLRTLSRPLHTKESGMPGLGKGCTTVSWTFYAPTLPSPQKQAS